MAKLYPPYLEGTLPAFCLDANGDGILTIPFAHNKAVSIADFNSISVKVKTVQNDLLIADFNTKDELCEWDNKEITELKFTVKSFAIGTAWTDIRVGQFYKIQLAYRDIDDIIGYYSTVGVVKCTSLPSVTIKGFEPPDTVNNNSPEFLGVFHQAKNGDITEKVYSSRFLITDLRHNVIEDTGDVLHNVENNPNSYESVDSFEFNRDLNFGEIYKIQYIVTTTNGCVISSPEYLMTQQKSLAMELKGDLKVELNRDEGFIDVSIKGFVDDNGIEEKGNGTFLLSREDSVNPGVWEKLYKFALKYESPTKTIFRDFTIEHGKTYTYSLQQFNENKIYSGRKTSEKIYADFDDMFLFDGKQQLKLRFNPQISNFKTQLSESRSETIGSKYPFFFRNAKVGYKTFPISGLISMLSDDNEYFTSYESILRKDFKEDRHRSEHNSVLSTEVYKDTDLNSYNITSERLFKLKTLDWVNDGHVKLFKSPSEGNYLVRLMDNSLSPENGLGRMLHNYSGTAYECAECNYTNLVNFGIIEDTSEAVNEEIKAYVTTWREKRVSDISKAKYKDFGQETGVIFETGVNGGMATKNLLEADIKDVYTTNLKFTNFLPGTRIRLVFDFTGAFDSDDYEEITIGSTGAYFANDIRRVYGIYLLNDSQEWVTYQDYLRYKNLKDTRISEALWKNDKTIGIIPKSKTLESYIEDAVAKVEEWKELTGEDKKTAEREKATSYARYLEIKDFAEGMIESLQGPLYENWTNTVLDIVEDLVKDSDGELKVYDFNYDLLQTTNFAKKDLIASFIYYIWSTYDTYKYPWKVMNPSFGYTKDGGYVKTYTNYIKQGASYAFDKRFREIMTAYLAATIPQHFVDAYGNKDPYNPNWWLTNEFVPYSPSYDPSEDTYHINLFTPTEISEWKAAWKEEFMEAYRKMLANVIKHEYGTMVSDEVFETVYKEYWEFNNSVIPSYDLSGKQAEEMSAEDLWLMFFKEDVQKWWESDFDSDTIPWNKYMQFQKNKLALYNLEKIEAKANEFKDQFKQDRINCENKITVLNNNIASYSASIEDIQGEIAENDALADDDEKKWTEAEREEKEKDLRDYRALISDSNVEIRNIQRNIQEIGRKINRCDDIINNECNENIKQELKSQITKDNNLLHYICDEDGNPKVDPDSGEFIINPTYLWSYEYEYDEPSQSAILWDQWYRIQNYLRTEATMEINRTTVMTNSAGELILDDRNQPKTAVERMTLKQLYDTILNNLDTFWKNNIFQYYIVPNYKDTIEDQLVDIIDRLNDIYLKYDSNWDQFAQEGSVYCGTLLSGDGVISYEYQVPVRNNFDSITEVKTDIGSYRQFVGPVDNIVENLMSPDGGTTQNVREEMTKICMSNYHKRPVEYLYIKEDEIPTIYSPVFEDRIAGEEEYRSRDAKRYGSIYKEGIPLRGDLKFYWSNNFSEDELFNDEESKKYSPFALYVITSPVIGGLNYYEHVHTTAYTDYRVENNKKWLISHKDSVALDTILRFRELRDAEARALINHGVRTKEEWDEKEEKYKKNNPWKEFDTTYHPRDLNIEDEEKDEEFILYRNSIKAWNDTPNLQVRTYRAMHLDKGELLRKETTTTDGFITIREEIYDLADRIQTFYLDHVENNKEFMTLFTNNDVDLTKCNDQQVSWLFNNGVDILINELETFSDYFAPSAEAVKDILFPNVDLTEETGCHVANHLFEKYYIDAILRQQSAEELLTQISSLYKGIQKTKTAWYDAYILPDSDISYDDYREALNNLNVIWAKQPKVYVLDAWSGTLKVIGDGYLYNPVIEFNSNPIDLREIENYSLDNIDASEAKINVGNGIYGEVFFRQATKTYELEEIEQDVVKAKNTWQAAYQKLKDSQYYYYKRYDRYNGVDKKNVDSSDIANDEMKVFKYNVAYLDALDEEQVAYAEYLKALKKANESWTEQKDEESSNAFNS